MSFDPLPGLVPNSGYLLEDGRRPDFRDVFGHLARQSTLLETAVTRIRLSTLNLTSTEMGSIQHFRVLVAEVNALSMDAEARVLFTMPQRAANLGLLVRLLESGTLEVRSAPLAGWSPDFTVFFGADRPKAVLTGFHWFERPYPHRGPALASLHGADGAGVAHRRFTELWERAHDIGPALWDIVTRARGGAPHTRAATG